MVGGAEHVHGPGRGAGMGMAAMGGIVHIHGYGRGGGRVEEDGVDTDIYVAMGVVVQWLESEVWAVKAVTTIMILLTTTMTMMSMDIFQRGKA